MADFNPRPTQWIMKLTDADRQTHPVFGIMGGTWPRANPVFSLPAGTRKPTTNAATADLVQVLGLSQPFVISPTTGGVCLLDDDTGTLCGAVCAVSTTMNRHMFTQHPAQIVPYRGPNPGPHDPQAIYLSERALYKFVLDGGWKDAVFLREPGNPPSTLIVQIAQWLEHLAETDENFDVALYGDKFLRQFFP
ncbi:hypothetical protein FJTKL_01944 [Diaporthe vaccinii]|uniref:Uncharacterized protein n=1 Tax=Diaporthe vaccinii TaxID=105482 RepID=A0ABR4DZH9_9PEZI